MYISTILSFDFCLLMKRSLREPYTSWSVKQGSENGDAYIYLSTSGGGGVFYLAKWGAILLFKQPEDGQFAVKNLHIR